MINTNKVGIIGLGKLGLPLAVCIAEVGYQVIGFDNNRELIHKLKANKYSSVEPELNKLLELTNENLFFTTDIEHLLTTDIVYLILPTPSDTQNSFDDSLISKSIESLLYVWQESMAPKTIVIVSTVMPGRTEYIYNHIVKDKKIAQQLNLIYSPEFIALGSVINNLKNPDIILVGAAETTNIDLHVEIQQKISNKNEILRMSLMEAEIAKLLVNCYVTMKISFANFIGEIATKKPSINANQIAKSIGLDSRIGSSYLKPGLGFAGPCFPRDNLALISWSKSIGLDANLAKATEIINSRQPDFMIERILNTPVPNKKIGILGLAYKAQTNVIEKSQTIILAYRLSQLGFEIKVFDPYVHNIFNDSRIEEVNSYSELSVCDLIIVGNGFLNMIHNKLEFKDKILFT